MATSNGPKRDVSPEKYTWPKAPKPLEFNEAMNKPNDPQKRYRPTAFNVTDDYTSGNVTCHEDED